MFNKKMKIMMSMLFIFVISACGGSGGGGEAPTTAVTPTATPTPIPTVAATPAPVADSDIAQSEVAVAMLAMNNLKAEAGFKFAIKQQVSVALDLTELLELAQQTGQRAYVSVYHEYTKLPTGGFYPNASSRVLSGEVSDGQFQHSFIRLNNQASYLVEIWFYNGELPIQKELTVAANNISW